MADKPDTDDKWHLDRKVPLALIVTIAIQTGAAIWWASSQSARMDYVEKQLQLSVPWAGQIIRLETKVDAIDKNVAEIKDSLRRPR